MYNLYVALLVQGFMTLLTEKMFSIFNGNILVKFVTFSDENVPTHLCIALFTIHGTESGLSVILINLTLWNTCVHLSINITMILF